MLAIACLALPLESCARKATPQSSHWQVLPNSVNDGDTFKVTNGSKELKIRMCGIDAPEKKQPLGIQSRDYLRSLLSKDNGQVILVITDTDKYGRTVAEVFVSDGGDRELFVNGLMVQAGLAYEYKRYSGNCPNKEVLTTAEEMALEDKAGVWANPNSIKPWVWRRQKR